MGKYNSLSQILTMARTGSPARAWTAYVESGWDAVLDNPKALTLKGRLLKDQAKAAARSDQEPLYAAAAKAYNDAAALGMDSYPLINAAALSLLGGDSHKAAELAAHVLGLIDNNPNEGENGYWRGATRAEALLLMHHEAEARTALSDAISHLPDAWEDHAATIGQFSLILDKQGRSKDWLDNYRPPSSVHFSGIIQMDDKDGVTQQAIENFLAKERPGFAYGALAAGTDLLFAKAFLAHKAALMPAAQLHITLPLPAAQFRALSVQPFGDQWLADFDDVMAQADTVTILGMDDPPLELSIQLADDVAMGSAMRNAANLQSRALALTIMADGESLRPHLDGWQQQGLPITIIKGKRLNSQKSNSRPQKDSQSIATLIWVKHGNADQLSTIIGDSAIIHRAEHGHWLVIEDVSEAWRIASTIQTDKANEANISLLHNIMDVASPAPQLLARAKAYTDAAQPGIVSTDHISAMVMRRNNLASNIEEIGALRTIWGALPLWRII